MFGNNEIVGQKYFKDAGEKLFITSIFGPTIQGEGPYTGHSAFFIRLAKCNLNCGFCDTYFDDGNWMTINEIIMNLEEKAKGSQSSLVIITGGEPLLQKNIVALCDALNDSAWITQIESNGIIYQPIHPRTTLVISPKCTEKDGHPVKYIKPHQKNLAQCDSLKFVMCADWDSPYSSVPDWAIEWQRNTLGSIYVSPMNIYNEIPEKYIGSDIKKRSDTNEIISFWTPGLLNIEENKKNHEYTAQYCIDNDLIFNLQMHLYAGVA